MEGSVKSFKLRSEKSHGLKCLNSFKSLIELVETYFDLNAWTIECQQIIRQKLFLKNWRKKSFVQTGPNYVEIAWVGT